MVTRNRKFPTQHGYSRNYVKRDTEQLLTEDLDEPTNRLTGLVGQPDSHPRSRVALELEPSVLPRTGIDLTAVRVERTAPGPAAEPEPWWARLILALFRWISWR